MVVKLETSEFMEFQSKMNTYGESGTPFVFVIDYKLLKPKLWKLEELVSLDEILYDFKGFSNVRERNESSTPEVVELNKKAISFEAYEEGFNYIVSNIKAGNSFLVNYTQPTEIAINLTLEEVFRNSKAPYKFLWKEQFVCFSPEIFITIANGEIASYPMKGTIRAEIPQAEEVLLNDPKEQAEHATIVDLIRNDISRVANQVSVKRYRYLEEVETLSGTLLQASSEIVGTLEEAKKNRFGDIFAELLPAGSICGAPKDKTLEIIEEAEKYDRGYYSGVMGYFDGETLQSAVMIRFIEKQEDTYIFKSGGGITSQSNPLTEYQELLDKVYVPILNQASSFEK